MSHQVAADDKAGANSATEQLEYANGVKDATENVINEDIMVVRTMNPNEKAAALAAASLADPGVKYMSRRGLQLLGIVLVCLVCGTDNGFDSGAMSNINAMQPFLDFFGFEEAQASTGILFGMYTVGGVSGFFLNASLPDLLGRRKAMAISNSILIVGILLAGLSRNLAMFLIGRYFMGLGAICASAAARSYIVEIAPVKHRGLFLGSYNVVQNVGSIMVSGSGIGFGYMTSEWGWRGLLLVALYGPIINLSSLYFIPESPRWLYARGHKDDALHVIAKFHSRYHNVDSPMVQLEIQEMEEEIQFAGTARKPWDLKRLFATRSNRFRMGLSAMIGIYGQTLGPATTYFTLLLKVAGINSLETQRVLNFVNTIVVCSSGLAGAIMMDRVGRRPITIFGTSSACIGMFLIGGLLSQEHIKSYANAGIAFIFIYQVCTQVAWVPINNLYPAEIMTFDIRGKGLAFQALCTQAAGLIGTFGVPAALVKLDYKLYFIFGAWDALGVLIQWAYMAETKGIPLEQMEDVFSAPIPKKRAAELIRSREERRKQGIADGEGIVATNTGA